METEQKLAELESKRLKEERDKRMETERKLAELETQRLKEMKISKNKPRKSESSDSLLSDEPIAPNLIQPVVVNESKSIRYPSLIDFHRLVKEVQDSK